MVLQTERYNGGGYHQQSYSSYQGPIGGYNNFQGVTDNPPPYLGSFPGSNYSSVHGHQSGWSNGSDYYGNGPNHYLGGGFVAPVKPAINGYGSSHYESSYTYGSPHHQGHGSPHGYGHGHENTHNQGYGNTHGHGSPHHQGHGSPHGYGYENTHGHGHGSPKHHGHGSPTHHGHDSSHNQGQGSPHHQSHGSGPLGFVKPQGLGGAITNKINKLTHGHNIHGSGSPNYGHGSSGYTHSYNQQHHQPSWTVKGLSDDDDE